MSIDFGTTTPILSTTPISQAVKTAETVDANGVGDVRVVTPQELREALKAESAKS